MVTRSLSDSPIKPTEAGTPPALATEVVNDGSYVVRMWQNGPLRRFCSDKERPNSSFLPYPVKNPQRLCWPLHVRGLSQVVRRGLSSRRGLARGMLPRSYKWLT